MSRFSTTSFNYSVIPSISSLTAEYNFSVNCVGLEAREEAFSFLETSFLEKVFTGLTSSAVDCPAVLSKKLSISFSGMELWSVRSGFMDSTLVISS